MADIKTILRELSVILGYILAKYKLEFAEDYIDVKTYLEFIKKYCMNINECNSEIQKIEALDNFVIHKDIIKNGLILGKLLFEKLNLDGDIYWEGAKVKSRYPFDIKIGGTGVSLKEDSYIIKNPSFADYLNALVQPGTSFKNIHVFRKFAPDEFKKWYDYTYKKIMGEFSNHNINEIIFKYPKHGTYIKRGAKGLIFGEKSNEIEIGINDNLDEITFNSRLGGFVFEHTVAKWIKENLEKKDNEYESLKKDCSLKAGENLKKFINENLKINSNKILELFQIYDKPYYYGKSYGRTYLYKVPSNDECKIKLIGIDIEVPITQLNVYFTFEVSNINGSNSINVRVECRYSHGQFKGIPEAKLYYTDKIDHLKNLYEVIE
jgi:hypothetical protein